VNQQNCLVNRLNYSYWLTSGLILLHVSHTPLGVILSVEPHTSVAVGWAHLDLPLPPHDCRRFSLLIRRMSGPPHKGRSVEEEFS
jgi:hypothetical protein